MSLFSIDLEQCPPFYRADLKMTIEVEICKAERIQKAIEDHNETKVRAYEYQQTLEYILYLNRLLSKLEVLVDYDRGIV